MVRCFLELAFSVCFATHVPAAWAAEDAIIQAAKQVEIELEARVGLAIHDTGSGRNWHYNADERFPMASTFKTLACAALLARIDAGEEEKIRHVPISQTDLVTYSPVTEQWVDEGARCLVPDFDGLDR